MALKKHAELTTDDGIHVLHSWTVANLLEREALELGESDVGKLARQLDTGEFWLFVELGVWRRIEREPLFTAPVSIGTANAEGESDALARADHVHDGSGLLADEFPERIYAQASEETEGAPIQYGDPYGGESPYAARIDHVHAIETAEPVDLGVENAEGTSKALARADHVHDASALTTAIAGKADATATTTALAGKADAAATTTALATKADKLFTINPQTGTAYTLVNAVNGHLTTLSNVAAITVTVPGTLTIGSIYPIAVLNGAGQVTFVGSAGLTLQPPPGLVLKSRTGTGVARLTVEIVSAALGILSGDVATS